MWGSCFGLLWRPLKRAFSLDLPGHGGARPLAARRSAPPVGHEFFDFRLILDAFPMRASLPMGASMLKLLRYLLLLVLSQRWQPAAASAAGDAARCNCAPRRSTSPLPQAVRCRTAAAQVRDAGVNIDHCSVVLGRIAASTRAGGRQL